MAAMEARNHEIRVNSKAENTRRGYASDIKMFVRWCVWKGFSPLPATPKTVSLYLTEMATGQAFPDDAGRPCPRKAATIARHATSIASMHKFEGFPSPCSTEEVKETIKGINRRLGTRPTKKEPALVETIELMVDACRDAIDEKHPERRAQISARDRAILLLGFGSAFRQSEIVALNVGDVEVQPEGLVILLRRSKGDQEGHGRYVNVPCADDTPEYCACRTYTEWLKVRESLAVPSEAVFVSLSKRSWLSRLVPESVAAIVKRSAMKIGLDPSTFGGHSLRRGHVTSSKRSGTPFEYIQEQTGHKDFNTLVGYFEKEKSWDKVSGQGLFSKSKRRTKDDQATSKKKPSNLTELAALANHYRSVAVDYDKEFFESISTGSVNWRDPKVFEHLFSSSQDSRRPFYPDDNSRLLIDLIESQAIVVDVVKLIEIPKDMLVPPIFCDGGGDRHSRLKYIAALWVVDQYRVQYMIEGTWEAGRADILVPERKIAIECGDTEASKTVKTIAQGWTAMHVPFASCAPHAVRMTPQFPDMDKRMGMELVHWMPRRGL